MGEVRRSESMVGWARGRVAVAATIVLVLSAPPVAGRPGGEPPVRPTRFALLERRGHVARLEAEHALSGTRKPYVVLDVAERRLRYRLVGMTMREIPLDGIEIEGLRPAPRRGDPGGAALAGIFTFGEKEGDPRLSPLTPEQIEAGLDDENAADALPPSPPSAYALTFKQPVRLRIEGVANGKGVASAWSRLRSWWASIVPWRAGPTERMAVLRVALRVDEETAREVYRSLVPEERWLVLPPPGFVLPEAGQEPLPKPRPQRPVPQRSPPPAATPGIPFQIPSPQLNEQPRPGADPAVPPGGGPGEMPQGEPPAPAPGER